MQNIINKSHTINNKNGIVILTCPNIEDIDHFKKIPSIYYYTKESNIFTIYEYDTMQYPSVEYLYDAILSIAHDYNIEDLTALAQKNSGIDNNLINYYYIINNKYYEVNLYFYFDQRKYSSEMIISDKESNEHFMCNLNYEDLYNITLIYDLFTKNLELLSSSTINLEQLVIQ
jgi:hypothetical protein